SEYRHECGLAVGAPIVRIGRTGIQGSKVVAQVALLPPEKIVIAYRLNAVSQQSEQMMVAFGRLPGKSMLKIRLIIIGIIILRMPDGVATQKRPDRSAGLNIMLKDSGLENTLQVILFGVSYKYIICYIGRK